MYRVEGMTVETDPQIVYRFEAPEVETIRAFYDTYANVNSIIEVKVWKVKTMANGYRTFSAYDLTED
ncbi:MAG: hypothetical protein KAS36_10705 [Anaerolineales bacterium]|nr:hypothetical protein [Anaerolineales bacterium]